MLDQLNRDCFHFFLALICSKVFFSQVYTIRIVTSDLEYTAKRRFSEFEQFYYKNKLDCYLDVKLPPKTFFRAGWAEDVTKQRTI
jgi:hypothetical protein